MRNDCDNIFESTIDEKCYKTGYSYKEESNGWRKRTEYEDDRPDFQDNKGSDEGSR